MAWVGHFQEIKCETCFNQTETNTLSLRIKRHKSRRRIHCGRAFIVCFFDKTKGNLDQSVQNALSMNPCILLSVNYWTRKKTQWSHRSTNKVTHRLTRLNIQNSLCLSLCLPLSKCIWAKCLNQSILIRQTKCILGENQTSISVLHSSFFACVCLFWVKLWSLMLQAAPQPPGSRTVCCVLVNNVFKVLFVIKKKFKKKSWKEHDEILDHLGAKHSKFPIKQNYCLELSETMMGQGMKNI